MSGKEHDWGGFEHNLQSLRVVDHLEERYPAWDGLNLCFETREGILKHCSPANARKIESIDPGGVAHRFLDHSQPSLEAQLCNLADEIAYNAYIRLAQNSINKREKIVKELLSQRQLPT